MRAEASVQAKAVAAAAQSTAAELRATLVPWLAQPLSSDAGGGGGGAAGDASGLGTSTRFTLRHHGGVVSYDAAEMHTRLGGGAMFGSRLSAVALGESKVLRAFRAQLDSLFADTRSEAASSQPRRPPPPPLGTGPRQTTAGVGALVERLEAPADRPVVVIGRSLGATVGILAAAECPRIDAVVAIAPYETLAVPLSQRIRLRGLPDRPVTWLAIRVLARLGRRPRSTRAAAARLPVPLLVVQGTADPISPEPGARAIADAAANARYELVDGAGHGDHWDLEPERLDQALDEFLAGVHRRRDDATTPVASHDSSSHP